MRKAELLAPAGNYEALLGAIAAGADAVYLGGEKYGARAYADNFTEEELCEGIRYAHVFDRKVYLTVNTLLKQTELEGLYDDLAPLYLAGLDGVIIQDYGVFQYIRDRFPFLELHVSTQMTVTGPAGAALLKQEGADRIVPARELSLREIMEIKKKTDIEIETFIHGAMCYSYSGQCLFSSLLGGRSGNRGRCAQPCRLPYSFGRDKQFYPLSMKDMCTVAVLPELIRAGIDSFKIEGRMKKPEYAAGVTAIYRKYMDLFYRLKEEGREEEYRVAEEDLQFLDDFYIRSNSREGYYFQKNGRELLTLQSPAYSGGGEEKILQSRECYIKRMYLPVSMEACVMPEVPFSLALVCGEQRVTIEGKPISRAEKQPVSGEKIKQQLGKTKDSCFLPEKITVQAGEAVFVPIGEINRLRREGLAALTDRLLQEKGYDRRKREALLSGKRKPVILAENDMAGRKEPKLQVLLSDAGQLAGLLNCPISSLCRIYVDAAAVRMELLQQLETCRKNSKIQIFLAFPHIQRAAEWGKGINAYELLQNDCFDGALVRSLETLWQLKERKCDKIVVTDANLYAFNSEASFFLKKYADEICLPYELNQYELEALQKNGAGPFILPVYGRIPLMVSANCLKKTTGACDGQAGFHALKDRMGKQFPVYNYCTSCYNVIYNSVPLSLHKALKDDKSPMPETVRIDLTTESREEAGAILRYFDNIISGGTQEPPYREYTTGHWKRGVE